MIRVAETRDAEQIAAIYRPYVEKTAITFEEKTADCRRDRGEDRQGRRDFSFHSVRGQLPLAALAGGAADDSRLRADGDALPREGGVPMVARGAFGLTFERTRRGRGIGRALLAALIALLRELGYVKIYAVITPPNPSA